MKNFIPLFTMYTKRRVKDFFIIFYSVVFPIVIIALLGFLTSTSYGTSFTSYEYYSIVIIPFCLLMGMMSVAYASTEEQRLQTSYRFISAPIPTASFVLAKLLSCVVALVLCCTVVLILSQVLFHLPVLENFFPLLLILSCQSIAITGLGLFFGLANKKFATIQNFLNLPIIIFGFLAGAFFPVSSLNPTLSFIIHLSPLTWINDGMIYCLYMSDNTRLYSISLVLFIMGILFTGISVKYFKKEAFI